MYIRIYMHIYLPRQMRGGTRDSKRNKSEFLSYERLSIAHQLTHCPYSSYQLSISIISSNSTVKNAGSWCVLQENHAHSALFRASAPLSPRLQGQEGMQSLTRLDHRKALEYTLGLTRVHTAFWHCCMHRLRPFNVMCVLF